MGVISGAGYDLTGRTIPADGLMVALAEHLMSPLIVDYQMKHPSVFRDRIPYGKMPLYNGYSQKGYIFRGTLGPQAGVTDWSKVEPSRKPSGNDAGVNRCSYAPQTYTWGFDAITFEGLKTSWKSPTFCASEIMYQDMAGQQLEMILKAGFQITDQIKETYAREMYLKTAADAGRFSVMVEGGGLSYVDSATTRVTYNPLTATSLTFKTALLDRLSGLNFSQLDLVHRYLEDSCPDAALSVQSGQLIFGLMIDFLDFEQMVRADDELRQDFRDARPQQLIEGFNMGFRVYRGWAIVHDPRQPRWNISTYDATDVTCTRVLPRRSTRAGVIGTVPETNPDYMLANLGVATVFLNSAIQILVPSAVSSIGGMSFGPAPDFNGAWTWINIKNEDTNPLGENGYFFSRYEYFCKMLEYSQDVHVLLYKRCNQSLKTVCLAQLEPDAASVGTLSVAPVAADFSSTLRQVTLTLGNKITAGVGDAVTVTNDAGANFAATIVDDSEAPTYTIGWLSGGANVPSAVTEVDLVGTTKITVA
jgi:hypothetical protein